jgi:phenylacetate-CoA ligase
MQLIQKQLDKIIINRVKGQDFNQETDSELLKEMHIVFGDSVEININDITEMPQEASGKYRFSICEV